MNSSILLVALVAALAASGTSGAAGSDVDHIKARLVDLETDDIKTITDQVVRYAFSYMKQGAKVSTVGRVVDFLQNSSNPSSHYFEWSDKKLEAMIELRDFLALDTGNVCSKAKLDKGEQIHLKYVVENPRVVPMPNMFKLFFYHYMHMMSSMCSAEAVDNLAHLKSSAVPKSGLDSLRSALAIESSPLDYKDIYLFWNLLQWLPVDTHPKVSKYLSLDGPVRATFGVKKTKDLVELQTTCRTLIKPIYSKALLSTVRLMEMGYYPRQRQFLDYLNSNKQARRMYELTQVCEALLPVRFVELTHSNLNNSRLKLLSRDEVEKLVPSLPELPEEVQGEQCRKCSVEGLDKLPSVLLKGAVYTAMGAHSSVFARKRQAGEILWTLIKRMRPGVMDKLSHWSKASKFLDPAMDESMTHLDKRFSLVNVYSFEYEPENQAVDISRDVLMYFLNFVWWFLRAYS